MNVEQVLFKDEAGNNLAEARWNAGAEWWEATCARCDDDATTEWKYVDTSMHDVVAVAALHLGVHKAVTV